jgi:hypothetical protein
MEGPKIMQAPIPRGASTDPNYLNMSEDDIRKAMDLR